jgi:hypothetical protein
LRLSRTRNRIWKGKYINGNGIFQRKSWRNDCSKPGGQISQNVKPDGSSNIQSAPGANRCAFDACKALAKEHGYSEAVKIFSPDNPDQANLDEAVRLINDSENKYSEEFLIEINSINNSSNIDLLDSCFKLKKHMEKLNRPCSFPPEVQKVLSNPFVRFLTLF